MSAGRSLLSTNLTGICMLSPACSVCEVKQKHSVLLINGNDLVQVQNMKLKLKI